MKKFLAPLICGFSIGVIQNVPIFGSFSCCILLPLAAYYSLILDQKANKNSDYIPYTKGLLFGFLTGVFAALIGSAIDITLTLIFKSNSFSMMVNDFIRTLQDFPLEAQLKKQMADMLIKAKEDIALHGFSFFYTFSMTIDQLFVNSIFGSIGGLIGVKIINAGKDRNNNNLN